MGLRDQSHSLHDLSMGSSPSLESKYPLPDQLWPGLEKVASTRALGAIGPQRCKPRGSMEVLKLNNPWGCTLTCPLTLCGKGTPTSLISITSDCPSQRNWLGPIVNCCASRWQCAAPRSVMVQRLAWREYSATFKQQKLFGSGWAPPRRAQA